jgi:hypothetical protein
MIPYLKFFGSGRNFLILNWSIYYFQIVNKSMLSFACDS